MSSAAAEWKTADVVAFLIDVGLPDIGPSWAVPNCIDGAVLLDLIKHETLDAALGNPIHASRIRTGLQRFEAQSAISVDSSLPPPPPPPPHRQTPRHAEAGMPPATSPERKAAHSLTISPRTTSAPRTTPRESNCYLITPPAALKHGHVVKSAGVLALRRSSSGREGIEVLLPVEYKIEGRVLNILGGQDEAHDRGDPLHTAAREFREETGSLLRESGVRHMCERGQRVYLGFGKYVLFVVRPREHSEINRLHVRYNSTFSWYRGPGAEAEFLAWVPWHLLERAVRDGENTVKVPHTTSAVVLPTANTRRETVRVSSFLRQAVSCDAVQKAIELALDEHPASEGDLKARINAELAECRQLGTLSDAAWLTRKLGSTWQLKLKAPPSPPPFPITSLAPDGPEWKRIVNAAKLPPNLFSRVASVRECRVSARQAEYMKEKSMLERKAGFQELRYPMHGTPERWRATAIAVNGFDVSIRLNGRSYGNGVYSVLNDPSTPLGYTANAGSLLVMKALYTPEGLANKGTPPTDGNVLVFSDPKHVLPEAIIDFADATQEKTAIAKLHAEQAAQIKQRDEEHARMTKDVEDQEKRFADEHLKMGRASLAHYTATLEQLRSTVEGIHPDAADAVLARLDARFERERKQFTDGLPIYSDKPKLVAALRQHKVLLVTAPTGSGKSTQLPQYIADEVLAPDDQRQIAVLQPRRVNASSLCERVAEERGSFPGQEVGYTVGRGESNATNGETRIHFMTHGLFVQRAQNMPAFAKTYAAVLLDEAHERSVEIDVSFALLRELTTAHDVRLVVMSATIGKSGGQSVASRFQDFLAAPFGPQPPLLPLTGSAFPVFIRRCPVPDAPDDGSMASVLGSAGNSAVLASLALQQAVDILQTTTEGNVLVFFPGEGDISRAIRTCRSIFPNADGSHAAGAAGHAWSTTSSAYGSFFGSSFLGVDSSVGFSFYLQAQSTPAASGSSSLLDAASSFFGLGSSGVSSSVSSSVSSGGSRQRVGIYPFHGKLSPAERDQAVHHHEDRVIIFTTNYAETGLTIPNIRYVIDTGLERRMRWNPELGMSELTTQPITRSSMLQRTGRAGRVASGVSIRLYSEEAERRFDEQPPPSILEQDSQKVVLQLLEMRKRCGGKELELIDAIPQPSWDASARQLIEFGALDKNDRTPTKPGEALLRLGLDYRLGRFLIQCDGFGSLSEGVLLAALLACTGGEKLLPLRPAKDKTTTPGNGAVTTSKDFEMSVNRYKWEPLTNANACTVLTSVLAGGGPGQYEISGKRYEARLTSPGAIVQKNLETDYERSVREVGAASLPVDLHERFYDESGDHWTLLRIMQAFRSESRKDGELKWCQTNDFPYHILSEADTTYQHIQEQCVTLGMELADSAWIRKGGEPPSQLKEKILMALCAAYYDQLCTTKDAEQPNAGFIRLVPSDDKAESMATAQTAFQHRYGAHPGDTLTVAGDSAAASAASASTAGSVTPAANATANGGGSDSANPPEVAIRLDNRSVVWRAKRDVISSSALPPQSPSNGQERTTESRLLIFHSVMLTNGKQLSPQMQIASYVEPDWIKANAPQEWCSKAQFDQMMRAKVERACFTYRLGQHNRDIFLRDHGAWFSKMRSRFPSLAVDLDGNVLKVTCHKVLVGLIKERVERRIEMLQQEDVYVPVPKGANIGKFIGKFDATVKMGSELFKLQSELGQLVRNALGEEDYENKKLAQWIFVEGKSSDGSWSHRVDPKERVRIVFKGRVKALMPVIVGRVRSALIEKCELQPENLDWPTGDTPVALAGASSCSAHMMNNKRLMLLSQQQKPPPPQNLDDAKLHVAHAAIFDAGAVVYGGFLRDWIIRGEPANDVDVNTSDYSATERAMDAALQPFGITLHGSQAWGETKAYRRLTFKWSGSQVEVDLVNPSLVPPTAPGVDCDVGNLKLDRTGGLQLKVPRLATCVSLAKSIKHAQSKKFVLFYDPSGDVAQKRLHKYVQRGWTCKSPVPAQLGLPTARLKPKQKYARPFWQM